MVHLEVQMARFLDRQKALELRTQGKSYSQIKSELGISKSTLSYWLRDYPLSPERIRELRDFNHQRIERYIETRRKTRETRLKVIYNSEKKFIFPLSKRDLSIGGLFLYWGEGLKSTMSEASLSNTDPAVIKFFIHWAKECLGVPSERISFRLHLYGDMDINAETNFWIKTLKISKSQFSKPYIKTSLRSGVIYNKGGFGHGTCNARIYNARLAEKVVLGIKSIRDSFGP